MILRYLALSAALLASAGCSVNLARDTAGESNENVCQKGSKCGDGECWSGACVAHQGTLDTLLLAVVPPSTVPGIAGVRFLQARSGLSRSALDTNIDLERTVKVRGFVRPDATAARGCDSSVSPLEVTLTPRETAYGLPSVSYVAHTTLATSPPMNCEDPDLQQFAVELPPEGSYDVYLRPLEASTGVLDAGARTACGQVPQLFSMGTNGICLPPLVPREFKVRIGWPEGTGGAQSLDGWSVDIIHPLTGHPLSDALTLGSAPYDVDLLYSEAAGESLTPGRELVRLTPPEGVVAPTVQLVRSGLEASSDPAATPPIGPFPAPVKLESWVWHTEDGHDVPVPGTVLFTAKKLDGIAPGIFASFSTSVEVGSDGRLAAELLPGDYRVRVIPQVGLGLAATEDTLSVQCRHDPATPTVCQPASPGEVVPPQAGHVLHVPSAATVTGIVVAPLGGKVDRVTIQAQPAALRTRACAVASDGGACSTEPLGVLDVARGEDAFVPRSVTAIAEVGRFTLADVDCGGCTPETGALFDVSVRPPEGSRWPWLVRSGVIVGGDVALGTLEVPLPVIQRGVVEVLQGDNAVPVLVPGALISAYVLRDQDGAPIRDPEGLPTCVGQGDTGRPTAARCIRSVLQVAETRAGEDGTYELVLPAAIQ